jgi:hypothetical protein
MMIGLWIGLDWNDRQGASTTAIFDNFKDNLDYCRRRCSNQVVEEKERVMTSTNKSCNNNVYNIIILRNIILLFYFFSLLLMSLVVDFGFCLSLQNRWSFLNRRTPNTYIGTIGTELS